jgi:2-succinyl-5-enolpyruvyl-6-hydroxy-3-cyclohexene-1-carboxylate synthase
MTNIARAREVIAQACALGVRDFCVCSGSRNSPLLAILAAAGDLGTYSFVDERAASFFALGRARRDRRPVAIVTTSGTAVAELLPAAIEAYYSGVPLILITADRPARFRGTGAPQCIEQEKLFGVFAARGVDEWNRRSPLHWNVEFDEPLIDDEIDSSRVVQASSQPSSSQPAAAAVAIAFRHPLVIVGGLTAEQRPRVREFLVRLNAPAWSEPLSGLREDPALERIRVVSGERMLGRAAFDGVVRIGDVPTLRFWRDLEESRRDLPVLHFSDLPFPGLTRGEVHPIAALDGNVTPRERDDSLFAQDRKLAEDLGAILDDEPDSELAMIRRLSRELPHGSRIYLGNSLPIREWDLAATREWRGYEMGANRGANGIDGQLSTFFGWCAEAAPNTAILGDLTALYDLNAPWIAPQIEASYRIVIINNRGGRIFERVPSLRALSDKRLILNQHDIRFDDWSRMFGIEDRVEELRPDEEATRRVWTRYDELWS